MNRSIWAGENIHGNSKTDIMHSFTIYIYKHPCGGANRTVFSTLKITIPCASPRKLCVILGSKNYPKSASVSPKKHVTTVSEPLVGQLHFLPSYLRWLFQLLGTVARSTQSLLCFADLCWSCLSFWYECPVEAYLWFSSTCARYHLCAHSKMVLVLFASSEQILQQRDSLPHVSTGMSSTRRGMPLHHQWPSKIPFGSSPC